MKAAHAAAKAEVHDALSLGLLPSEVAPFRIAMHNIHHEHVSATPNFLNLAQSSLYAQQADQYRQVLANVRQEVVRVTAHTRNQAASALDRLAADIGRATSLDVSTVTAESVLTSQGQQLARSLFPRDFRTLTAGVHAATDALDRSMSGQSGYVRALLQQAHGDLKAVARQASTEAASAQPRLAMMSLFTNRSDAYQRELSGLVSIVAQQHSPFSAAVKESHVHDLLGRIDRDYAHTVPPKVIVVSTENQSVTVYQDGRQIYRTPATTGGPELPTDHGVFHIYEKVSPFTFHSPFPLGTPYYYPPTPVTYWMPFDGGQGLHDAWWRPNFGPGSNVAPTDLGTGVTILGTHGCVNLPADAAAFIWNWAPLGTTVVVH